MIAKFDKRAVLSKIEEFFVAKNSKKQKMDEDKIGNC